MQRANQDIVFDVPSQLKKHGEFNIHLTCGIKQACLVCKDTVKI